MRAALVAVCLLLFVPAAAGASYHFGGLVGHAPPPQKCSPAPCPEVDASGAAGRTMADATGKEISISPHVVRVGENFTVTITRPDTGGNVFCDGTFSNATKVEFSGEGPAPGTATCVYKATSATNFTDPELPGSPSGPAFLMYDQDTTNDDQDYYAIVENAFELAGRVTLAGGGAPPFQVTLEITGGPSPRLVDTNLAGAYSIALPAGTYTVTPQADGAEPASRTVDLSDHRRAVDFEVAPQLVVNQTEDGADAAIDGTCDVDAATAGAQCSLRAALQEANAPGGEAKTVGFDIEGVPDIVVTDGALPEIQRNMVIDGASNGGVEPAIVRGGDLSTDEGKATAVRGLKILNAPVRINDLAVRGFADQIVVDALPTGTVTLQGVALGTNRALGPAPERIEALAESHCANRELMLTVLGTTARCAGLHVIEAGGLTVENSLVQFNIGCGICVDDGVTGVRIDRSQVLDGQEEPLTAQADAGVITGTLVASLHLGLPRDPGAGTETGPDADGWRLLGNDIRRSEITGEDNVIGAPGDGNGNLIGGQFRLTGDRNTVQHNTIETPGAASSRDAGLIIRGARNQIGGAAAGEGNLINHGPGISLGLEDWAAGPDGAVTEATPSIGAAIRVECPGLDCAGPTPANSARGTGNVIQGNEIVKGIWRGGIFVRAPGTVVRGNRIRLSDLAGVFVQANGAIIEDNQISGTTWGPGVYVHSGTGTKILGNFFDRNAGLAIDLGDGRTYVGGEGPTPNDQGDFDAGANELQNHAVPKNAFFDAEGVLHIRAEAAPGAVAQARNQFFAVQSCRTEHVRGELDGLIAENQQFGSVDFELKLTPPRASFGPLVRGNGIVATTTFERTGTSEVSPCVTIAGPPVAPECRLEPGGNVSGLKVKVTCDAAASVTLGGTATIGGRAQASKRVKLKTVRRKVGEDKTRTLKLKVPRRVRRAVRRGRRVSVRLKLTATAGGVKSVETARIKRLKKPKL